MTDKKNKMLVYFSVLYFLNMSTRALFSPFITVYLQEKGLDAQNIGLITAINSFIIIASQPFWGMVADRTQSARKVLIACLIFQALVVFTFNLTVSFFMVTLTLAVSTFFSSPEGPLFDTWVLGNIKKSGEGKDLGRLKMWGAIGYAGASIVGGWLIDKYSTRTSLPIFAALLIVIGIILFLSRSIEKQNKNSSADNKLNIGVILHDKKFIFFLVYIFFMQIPHRAAFTFYPVLISTLGGNTKMVGYASSIMFISEALIMYFTKNLLKRIKPLYLIMASSLFFMTWQILFSMMTMSWHVAAAAVLDGPAFALLTIGIVYYMDQIAPENLRSTYQTVTFSVYFGLSGIAGNYVGGWIIENIGFRTMYLVGAGITIMSTVIFCLANVVINKRKKYAS